MIDIICLIGYSLLCIFYILWMLLPTKYNIVSSCRDNNDTHIGVGYHSNMDEILHDGTLFRRIRPHCKTSRVANGFEIFSGILCLPAGLFVWLYYLALESYKN